MGSEMCIRDRSGSVVLRKPIDPKCFGSRPPQEPKFDPKTANFYVIGIHVENGSFTRKRLIERDSNGKKTDIFDKVEQAHINGKHQEVRKILSGTSDEDFRTLYLNAQFESKTPYYNIIKGHSFIHYVILNEDLRFAKKKQFNIYESQVNRLYSPYYGQEIFLPNGGEGGKRRGKVATLKFYNKNMGIGEPPKAKIKKKEVCEYPYDFVLTSRKAIRDRATGERKYQHFTPIVVDPRNGSTGPPS